MFEIRSVSSSKVLRLRDRKDFGFFVELEAYDVTARTQVWSFKDDDGLVSWLEKLASHQLPWDGAEEWMAYERNFALSATCRAGGLVIFVVKLDTNFGGSEAWRVSAELNSELGQLPDLAKAADRFFTDRTSEA